METTTTLWLLAHAALGTAAHAADARWGVPARARLVDLCSPAPQGTSDGLLAGRSLSRQLMISLGAGQLATLASLLWGRTVWYTAPVWSTAGGLAFFAGIQLARLRPWATVPAAARTARERLSTLPARAAALFTALRRRRDASPSPAQERQARIERMDRLLGR